MLGECPTEFVRCDNYYLNENRKANLLPLDWYFEQLLEIGCSLDGMTDAYSLAEKIRSSFIKTEKVFF